MEWQRLVCKLAVQLKQLFLDQITNYASNMIHKAVIEIAGVERDYEIMRSKIENGKIIKYVHVNEHEGIITKARLIDNQRRDLLYNEMSIKKLDDGFMMVFTIKIEVKGGVVQ